MIEGGFSCDSSKWPLCALCWGVEVVVCWSWRKEATNTISIIKPSPTPIQHNQQLFCFYLASFFSLVEGDLWLYVGRIFLIHRLWSWNPFLYPWLLMPLNWCLLQFSSSENPILTLIYILISTFWQCCSWVLFLNHLLTGKAYLIFLFPVDISL